MNVRNPQSLADTDASNLCRFDNQRTLSDKRVPQLIDSDGLGS